MPAKRKIISIHSKKESGLTLGKFFYRLALISFAGSVVYVLFFSGYLLVNRIEIGGIEELDSDLVSAVSRAEIEGKYLGAVDKNNMLLIRKSRIEKALFGRFKKIENIEVRKKFPDALLINIKERHSAMILCSAECYMIDDRGIAYSERDYSLPEVGEERLPTLRDSSRGAINLGESVFDAEYLEYFSSIEDKMKNILGIEMGKIYETPSRVSSDIRGVTSEEWKIYFNENISLDKEIEMLKVVLDEKIGEKRRDLEYVDLRADNKVYYKFKEGTQEQQDVKPEEEKKTEEQSQPASENKKDKKKK